jgi:uncharacterized protein GlcG (DUF336 family)
MGQIFSLTSKEAEKIIVAAIWIAEKSGKAISISLHNRDQTEIARFVMDGVKPLTAEIACSKSFQSSWAGKSTKETRDKIKAGEMTPADLNLRNVIPWAGGLPIFDKEGHLIGGIGVSNLKEDEDEDIAMTAVLEADLEIAPK